MSGALIPANPGVLSALGMATADAIRDYEVTVLAPLTEWGRNRRAAEFKQLRAHGVQELRELGFSGRAIELEFSLDLRYQGQSFELTLPEEKDAAGRFQTLHEQRYGWTLESGQIELVTLRARATGATGRRGSYEVRKPRRRTAPARAFCGKRRAFFGRWLQVDRVQRSLLKPGHRIQGPAIIEESTSTIFISQNWQASLDAFGNTVLSRT